jgi:hypothetical protein
MKFKRVETQRKNGNLGSKSEKAAWRPRRLFVGNMCASVNVIETL